MVVDPRAEQTILSPQVRPWPMFTPGGDGNDHEACETLRFVNRVLSLTPRRGPVEQALARLGADTFARHVARPAHVNIGVGFGEEVCREIYESPLNEGVTFTTETGVYGRLPAPGIYFGAAVNPERVRKFRLDVRFLQEASRRRPAGIPRVRCLRQRECVAARFRRDGLCRARRASPALPMPPER